MLEDKKIHPEMNLWHKVSRTNPKYTKKVKFGREFTAIDPMSQIMEATRMFGPAGQGWGWEVMEHLILPTNDVAVRVRVWIEDRDNYIEQWGQCGLYIDKSETRKDGDCLKKATTDGMTKGLSAFGFNADVFLGEFDDNKYVQQMKEEFSDKPKIVVSKLTAEQITQVNDLINGWDECKDLAEIELLNTAETKDFMKSMKPYPEQYNGMMRASTAALKRIKLNTQPATRAA